MRTTVRIYLDYNATAPVPAEVSAEVGRVLRDEPGNPSSVHAFGQRAKACLDEARQSVAALIEAEPSELVFTAGGTEANNLALRGAAEALAASGRRHIVTTGIEHEAVLMTLKALERQGCDGHGPAGRRDRRARARRADGGDDPRHRPGLGDDGQQRGGDDSADRRPGGDRPRPPGDLSYRRRPGGRQAAPVGPRARRRPAVALRPQVREPEGRRRVVDSSRRAADRADDGRTAGAQSARRHRERRVDRRPWRRGAAGPHAADRAGVRDRRAARPARARHPGRGADTRPSTATPPAASPIRPTSASTASRPSRS